MGNNESSDWRAQFDLTDAIPPIRRAVHRQTKQRYQLLTLFPSNQQELQALLNRIKLRTSKPSAHLLSLHGFWRSSDFGPCNSRPSIDLIFKAGIPLEEYLTLRRVKNQSFSKEEVEYVVGRVAAALGDIREMREEYGAVHLSSVFVDGEVKLKDPILLKEEGQIRRSRKVVGFPSPQKLYTYFDTLSTFEEHTSDLFSLGMLALQLIYPHQNLQAIYKNSNSRYLNCCIDANELRAYVNGVQDPTLRKYVTVLTDQQPNRRREIYHLLAVRNVSGTGLKLLNENPYEIAHSPEISNREKSANKAGQGNSVLLPALPLQPVPKLMGNFDFPQRPSEAQNLPSYPIQPSILPYAPPPLFPNTQGKPPEVDFWRPSHIFESGFHPLRENSESTPINKINGNFSNSSFRSPTFDFAFPKAPALSNPPSYQLYGGRVDKVSPKFIESTYRSSFIPMPQSEAPIVDSPMGAQIIEPTQVIHMPAVIPPQQNQTNQSPVIEQQTALPQKPAPKPQDSPQLQVKTSVEMVENPQGSFIQEVISSESTQNMIKFQSITSKMVESVNQIQKSPKAFTQREGFVVEQYDIGTRYEGFKKNGMRNGQGEFIYKEGSKYKGEWRDNKMEGYGTLYYPTGIVAYQGQWLNDEFDGLGTVYNDNPVVIKGGFDYTNFTILEEEWLRYEGQLKRDAKEGLGKLILTNGEAYHGMFQNDMVHGEGEFKRYNGSSIRGVWHEGLLKKIIQ